MRILTKSTWIAVCLLSGIFILSCKGKKDRSYPIPNNSELVVVIDPASISKKIVMDKISDFSITDLFDFSEEDTTSETDELSSILDDPTKVGIDILENIYAFKKNENLAIVAQLDDPDDFMDHLKNTLKKDIKKSNDYQYTFIDSILISWNKEHCIFLLKEDGTAVNKSELNEIILIKKEETVFNNPQFQKHTEETSDIFAWFSISEILKGQPVASQISKGILSDSYSSARINFEQGKINFKIQNFLSPALSGLLSASKLKTENLAQIKSPNYLGLGTIQLNMPEVVKFIKPYSSKKHFEKIGIAEQDLAEIFSGEVMINISELREIHKTFSSYTFDDDFNKIETIDSTTIVQPIFSAFIGTLHSEKTKKILDTLASKNLLDKKEVVYTFMLTDVPVNFMNQEKGVLITNQNKKYGIANNLEPEVADEISKSPIFIYGDPSKFFPLIKPGHRERIPLDQIEKALIKISKDEKGSCSLSGEIYLKNNEKNSLLTIVSVFKDKSKRGIYN